MKPDEIRKSYISAMMLQGAVEIPPAHIIPENDPSTLFVGSGMQPMVPYLLGLEHPMGNDLVNVQPCLRTGDIDEVGDLTHLTFFEMIGRWELGADPETYKGSQIQRVMNWQVDVLGLDPKCLYVSVYSGNESLEIDVDQEAIEIWTTFFKKHNIDPVVEDDPFRFGSSRGGRIFLYDDQENWWSRAGVPANMPSGEPGGPDSEMFYDFDPQGDESLHPAVGGSRFVEIGNNVFMSHTKTETGFDNLEKPNIDYGGGLERLCSAVSGNADIFRTPFFTSAIELLETVSGWNYAQKAKEFRIILDHSRASVFLLASGALPGNKDAGYVVRRLIRRATRICLKLNLPDGFMAQLAEIFIRESETYDFVQKARENIVSALSEEESQFLKTLRNGEKELRRAMDKGPITGEDAFYFYETYGFPIEITQEILSELGVELQNPDGFMVAQIEHSQRSKGASDVKFKGGLADQGEITRALHTATHLMLAGLRGVLGDHVHQRGSNITSDRIRFDFSHHQKVSREDLDQVEMYVNNAIESAANVSSREMDKQKALESGIEGSFWEKYPDIVTVYRMEDDDGKVWSEELCGGPHAVSLNELKDLGVFKIEKEQSSSSGVRRVKAVLA